MVGRTRGERTFSVLCVIGLLAHVSIISHKYFAYKTSTKVIIDTDSPIRTPTLSFCVRYIEFMNQADLLKFGIRTNDSKLSFTKYYKQSMNLKISDIFNSTPSLEKILISCMIRKPNQSRRFLRSTRDKDTCFQIFNIAKYYMQSFICYRFMPANASFFTLDELSHSYNYEYSMYAVRLMKELAHAESVLLILHYDPYPYLSRSFGALRKTRVTQNSEERPNEYYAQTKVTEIRLQPPPYDTACDVGHDPASKSECIIKSMRETGLDRVPNTEIVTRPYDLPHVAYNDDDNVTFRTLADRVYQQCQNKFMKSNCRYSLAETEVRMKADEEKESHLRIRVMGPRGPNTHVHSEPAFALSEYLLYVSSCFGIWLGVSVLHLNPVTLMSRTNQRRKCDQIQVIEKEGTVQSAYRDRGSGCRSVRCSICCALTPRLRASAPPSSCWTEASISDHLTNHVLDVASKRGSQVTPLQERRIDET